ncbi:MAG: hypothetical protein HC848_07735 [Limnobacter sp.]|nr:hypothetical protein [Limnobacter sp.]
MQRCDDEAIKLYGANNVNGLFLNENLQGVYKVGNQLVYQAPQRAYNAPLADCVYQLHNALEIAAILYNQKYGIHMVVHEGERSTNCIPRLLEKTLKTDTPKGLIWKTRYLKHVVPFVLMREKKPDGTFRLWVTSLDSTENTPGGCLWLLSHGWERNFSALLGQAEFLRAGFNEVCLVKMGVGNRQADPYSCRTDAVVMLKDALRHPHARELFGKAPEVFAADPQFAQWQAAAQPQSHLKLYRRPLPAALAKNVQTGSAFFRHNGILQESPVMQRAGLGPQTLAQHQKKYLNPNTQRSDRLKVKALRLALAAARYTEALQAASPSTSGTR